MGDTTLTGNEVAMAANACALAIAWWKQRPKTKWSRTRIAEFEALSAKLQAIDDFAYPNVRYDEDEGFNVADCGDEPIMALDAEVVAQTRKLGASETPKQD